MKKYIFEEIPLAVPSDRAEMRLVKFLVNYKHGKYDVREIC